SRFPPLRAVAAVGAVRDDTDVDAGQLAHHSGEQGAAEDLAAARFVGCADEDVGGAAFLGDAADGGDEVVAFLFEEVHPEDAGEPWQRRELRRLFFGRVSPRWADPNGVDVGAESLRGTPGAAHDPLRLRLRLDHREDAFADSLLAEWVEDITVAAVLDVLGDF